jgi:hypothetical protein
VFEQFKNQFDRDIEKYNNVCERNKKIADDRWLNNKVPKSTKNTTRTSGIVIVPKSTKNTHNDNDNDNINKKEYITSREEMNNFHKSLEGEDFERVRSKRLPLICLLDVMEWYPVERDLKFMRDWVDWLTEVCKRY